MASDAAFAGTRTMLSNPGDVNGTIRPAAGSIVLSISACIDPQVFDVRHEDLMPSRGD
jgi:hypothetical protein